MCLAKTINPKSASALSMDFLFFDFSPEMPNNMKSDWENGWDFPHFFLNPQAAKIHFCVKLKCHLAGLVIVGLSNIYCNTVLNTYIRC